MQSKYSYDISVINDVKKEIQAKKEFIIYAIV